jgi:hypothetical protein
VSGENKRPSVGNFFNCNNLCIHPEAAIEFESSK